MDNFNNLFLLKKNNLCIHVDEINKAILSLKFVNDQLSFLAETNDIYFWIGVIENLHNSLQNSMVLALEGTNGFSITEFSRKNLPEPENFSLLKRASEGKLYSFMNLYKKIKSSSEMKMYRNSQHFTPNNTQNNSVEMLHNLRNDLIHFKPKCWAIDIKLLLLITDDCIDIITFLAFECQNIIWYPEEARKFAKTFLEDSKQNLNIIEQKYTGLSY